MFVRTSRRTSALGSAVLALCFITSSIFHAPSAQASQLSGKPENLTSVQELAAADRCKQEISELRGTPQAKEKKIEPDQAVDFYCIGDKASLTSMGDPSITVSAVREKSEEPLTLYSYPTNTQPGEDPIQSISDNYTSRVIGTFFYGQDHPGTANDWIRGVDMMLNAKLKTTYHDFVLGWSAAVGPWDEYITLSGFVRLQRHEGIFPTTVVDHVLFNNGPGASADAVYSGGLQQPTRGGTYSMEVGDMHVINTAKAFSINIKGRMAVPRFLCNHPEQCKYPDGKEAPVFG